MTVAELIKHLSTLRQDMYVVLQSWNIMDNLDSYLLDADGISVERLSTHIDDSGCVSPYDPHHPSDEYVVFS